ncbi:MAG: hypothetical protein J1G01_03885 [Clostridiales bacterium]|nr:hypothetical protein [Clostridiales bacterium]
MKKKVKALVVAASVAAIAGIGAVSFAKWDAGSKNVQSTTGNELGTVSVLKFGETTIQNITGLKPLDQDASITASNYVKVEFDIVASEGYGFTDFKLTVGVSAISMTSSKLTGDNNTKDSGIFVSKTAPNALADTKQDSYELTYTIGTDASSGKYALYVWLQSDDIGDMGKTFTLTYTLSDGSSAKV